MQSQNRSRNRLFGKMLLFSRRVSSTNELAKRSALLKVPEGTIVAAEVQTDGRGRLGREWFSPKGGLWFSVVLRPKIEAAEAAKLVFAASLAVADALGEFCGLHAETKWPNDVLVKGKKICGILAEINSTGKNVNYAVVGVGLNANFKVKEALPKEVVETATSIEDELGRQVDYKDLLFAVLEKLDKVYGVFINEGSDAVLKRWKSFAVFLGHEVTVKVDSETFVGVASDVASSGALVLKLKDGSVREFRVGDVILQPF